MNYNDGSKILKKMGKVFADDEVNFPRGSYDMVVGFLHKYLQIISFDINYEIIGILSRIFSH